MENILTNQTPDVLKKVDEYYNIGIDRCINFCESQKKMYELISPTGNEVNVIVSIIETIKHFKKDIK